MCDPDRFEAELEAAGLSRRAVGVALAGLALVGPGWAAAQGPALTEREVSIRTPDGEADGWWVHPAEGRHPAVLLWPDILSVRPAMQGLARRLAGLGYAVLVVNPFYRKARAPVVPVGSSFVDPAVREVVVPLMQSLTPETHRRDAAAALAWLEGQAAVDPQRGVGTMGYCMGGAMALRTAAAGTTRVVAAASFHGGGLVVEGPESPHLLLAGLPARVLLAIARNDDEKEPGAKDVLRAAVGDRGEVEVYPALHGWCAPDSPAFDAEQAERAWSRWVALLSQATQPAPGGSAR